MTKRKKRSTLPPDRKAALFISEAFYEVATSLLKDIEERRVKGQPMFMDPADLAVAGTNLLLAVELAFKAVIGLKQAPPPTHDLVVLFETLHFNYQSVICSMYTEAIKRPHPGPTTHILDIALEDFGVEPPDMVDAKYDELERVLARSRNGFEAWRYLFEEGEENGFVRLRLDFHHLSTLHRVLMTVFVERISREERGPLKFGRRAFRIQKNDMRPSRQ